MPPLHPALVHFPIALLPAALAFDVAALAARRSPWLDRAAGWLYAAAAAAAAAAVWTGERAEEALLDLTPRAQAALDAHVELGDAALWAVVLLAAVRLVAAWQDRAEACLPLRPLRLVLLAAAAGAVALVLLTAHRGGEAVYDHGVGVQAAGR